MVPLGDSASRMPGDSFSTAAALAEVPGQRAKEMRRLPGIVVERRKACSKAAKTRADRCRLSDRRGGWLASVKSKSVDRRVGGLVPARGTPGGFGLRAEERIFDSNLCAGINLHTGGSAPGTPDVESMASVKPKSAESSLARRHGKKKLTLVLRHLEIPVGSASAPKSASLIPTLVPESLSDRPGSPGRCTGNRGWVSAGCAVSSMPTRALAGPGQDPGRQPLRAAPGP